MIKLLVDLFIFLANKLFDLVDKTEPFVFIVICTHLTCVDEDHVLDGLHLEVAHHLVVLEIHLCLVTVRKSYLLAHNTLIGLRDDGNQEVQKNDHH